jgi:hypothetical protein
MSEVDKIFAPGVLKPGFVSAIEECISNPNTFTRLRTCRSLIMSKEIIDNFLFNDQMDGWVPITTKGGGWYKWFLCRYNSNLYFVFEDSNHELKSLSARSTNLNEIIRHIRDVDNRGGVNIDGEIIPYDQVYCNSDEDKDVGALDFKTSMARSYEYNI